MMRFTEDQFARFATPPSQTERDKMDNAERAIRNAISGSQKLQERQIRVFAQGSYRNRVNVRADSDVDIAVVCSDTFFWEGPENTTRETFGIIPATYQFETFRADVCEALTNFFGHSAVKAGDKAFDISANTYRVDADVAPFFDHRRYSANGLYLEGTEMWTKSGRKVVNWPEQHYENGVNKNNRTGRTFKGCVRILKTVRYAMLNENIATADGTSSFLMECLIWNVPDYILMQDTWAQSIRSALIYLYNNTDEFDKCSEWGEVSELKYLFRGEQPHTPLSVNRFILDCWGFLGFE